MESEKEQFIRLIPASREALGMLDQYAAMLVEWNEKFNLVAPSTIPHVWNRHILDSAQLVQLVPSSPDQVVADLGSGAGFPGLVLSIMGIKNVNLIESTGKKADFLRAVIEKLKLDAIVHQDRIENLKELKADIITARALGSLNDLFHVVQNIAKKDVYCLFLKGQKADVELTEARKCWMFDCEKTQSQSDPSGSILAIRNLRYAKHSKNFKRR